MQVNAPRLLRSACVSILTLFVGIGVVVFRARAATYTAILTAGSVNWTATTSAGSSAVWSCSSGAPPDACGIYPGQLTLSGITDVANITTSGGGTVAVTSSIPNPVSISANTATVDVQSGGTLAVTGTSNSIAAGRLQVSGGNFVVEPGQSLTIQPTVGATSSLVLNSGQIVNGGNLFLATSTTTAVGGATMTWNGGTLGGNGGFTYVQAAVAGGSPATLNLTGANSAMTLGSGQTLQNSATTNLSSSTNAFTLASGSTFNNFATFSASADAPINGTGFFNNSGNFLKAGGTTNAISSIFWNGGTVNFRPVAGASLVFSGGGQQSGTFNIPAGDSVTFAATGALNDLFNAGVSFPNTGGVIVGTGGNVAFMAPFSIGGTLTNNGNIGFGAASISTVNVANFTQSASGSIGFTLAGTAPGQYDQLNVTGAANLAGNLFANTAPAFSVTTGNVFPVMPYGSRTGTLNFTPFSYPQGKVFAQYDTPNPSTLQLVAVAQADLGVTKTGPATLVDGQSGSYVVTVTNNGPAATTVGGTLTDTISGGTMTAWSSTTGMTCSGTNPVTCSVPPLAAGASASVTMTIVPTAPGTLSNTATVSGQSPSDPVPDPTPDSATVRTTVAPAADLGWSGVSNTPNPANATSAVTYTATLTNNGPDPASNATATFNLTGGGSITAITAGAPFTCTFTATSATCNATTFAIKSPVTFTITATAPNVAGSMTLTGNASSATTDPNTADNAFSSSTTINALQADVAISKSAPVTTIVPGSNVVFAIVVSNLGPSTAANVQVDDIPSASLTFLSATGACTSFPCTIPSIANGSSVSISATYRVALNATSFTNTAKIISSSTVDTNTANNSSSVTRTVKAPCPTVAPVFVAPADGQTNVPVSGNLLWTNTGASAYDVFLGPAGTGCSTLVGTVNGGTTFAYSGLQPNADYEASIVARTGNCPPVASQCIRFHTAGAACNLASPSLVSPQNGTTVSSPVALQWSPVSGADSYHVVVSVNGTPAVDATTTGTTLTVNVGNGQIDWSVVAISGNCSSAPATGRFGVCAPPFPPLAGVVGAPSSGHAYQVIVTNPQSDTTKYDYQEATNADFTDATTQTQSATSVTYNHSVGSSAQVFFYRVRAYNYCQTGPGGWSKTIRVVVLPEVVTTRPVLNVPVGTKDLVVEQVLIPGQNQNFSFTATATKPWIVKIVPSFGTLTPSGETLSVYIDPTQLRNGTFDASVTLTLTPLTLSDGRKTANGNTTYTTPVSVNIVTPVVPVDPSAPTSDSLIIPAVGHLIGVNSQWRSDIRVFNGSAQTTSYLLNFISNASTDVKQTTIETAPGDTTALDDIIHNWYGFGEVGDNASGVLEIRPLVASTGSPSALSTIVSSRTYNLSSAGTLGQFIPAVPFTKFVGGGTRLSLQQIAQNQNFRTNFGLVEASGQPASVVLSMFDTAGNNLFNFPVNLNGGEQKQLNALLSQQGFSSLSDGRMEVKVAGGDGKVTAYASVVDNASGDPLFVPAEVIGNTTAQTYVMPGVADLNTNSASWRTDMRVFNSGTTAQTATLTFYPEGEGKTPLTSSITVNPNEVKVLDNIVQSTFSAQNVGGAVHVDTAGGSSLVVTGRTYNLTTSGTLGQFIPAATLADSIANGGRALNILQVEDSVRYRTNVGLAEMSGKPAMVEISVVQPDTKITPSIQVPLQANEFVQFPLSSFGLGDVYNVRVSVRVVDGDGRVTAYGSVIDEVTTAPTYIAAQ